MWNLYDPLTKSAKNMKNNGVKPRTFHEKPSTVNQMFFMLENVGKLGSRNKHYSDNPANQARVI